MRKSDLQFVRDTLLMQKLLHEPSMHKTAQDGIAGVLSAVEGVVKGIYDPKAPVESILAFIGPGLLWVFGFKKFAVLYELAGALGFNWTEFFESIKEKLKPLLTSLVEERKTSSQNTRALEKFATAIDTDHITAIVQEAAEAAFSGEVDVDKLEEAVDKYGSIDDMLYAKKFAQKYGASSPTMQSRILSIMQSVGGNRVRKGILGIIIKFFSWILAAILISCGFAAVGGLASSILGIKKAPEDKSSTTTTTSGEPTKQDTIPAKSQPTNPNVKLFLNPDASQELFTTTYNDDKHIWLMHKNISAMSDALVEWAQELYPQFKDKQLITSNPEFNHTVQMFKDRNKNTQVDLLAVPPPFRSIKEIVDSFAADVAAHQQTSPNQMQRQARYVPKGNHNAALHE